MHATERWVLSKPLESFLAGIAGIPLTLYANWHIIIGSHAYNSDALIHEFWMRRFQDSELFTDQLTSDLVRTGYIPLGDQGLLWIASRVMDPVQFAELLPLVLVPACSFLLFSIVRAHEKAWPPAAWIAVILFLLPWEIHRFTGGHSRAFIHPVVLLTVYLLLRERDSWAAGISPFGALLYPTAGAVSGVIIGLSAFSWRNGFVVDRKRLSLAILPAVLSLLVVYGPRVVDERNLGVFTATQARSFPEFGPSGQMHFFRDGDTKTYLKSNHSGFHFGGSGSMLAVGALGLFLLRPANVRLIRREVWMMAVGGLGLFAVAHALLFRLYLPQRYTYPLIPFFCIAIGLSWKPTWDALTRPQRRFGRLTQWLVGPLTSLLLAGVIGIVAMSVFPLGPELSWEELADLIEQERDMLLLSVAAGMALCIGAWTVARFGHRSWTAATVSVLLGASLLVGEVAAQGYRSEVGFSCSDNLELMEYLQTTSPNSIIAGDAAEGDFQCIPLEARRPVVISKKLYQPWDKAYFREIRPRMFDSIRAYFGSSRHGIVRLREKYGADYLVVDRSSYRQGIGRWRGMAPFTDLVRSLEAQVAEPAAANLPEDCRTFESGTIRVFDLGCQAAEE
jgi:hypothetical protein